MCTVGIHECTLHKEKSQDLQTLPYLSWMTSFSICLFFSRCCGCCIVVFLSPMLVVLKSVISLALYLLRFFFYFHQNIERKCDVIHELMLPSTCFKTLGQIFRVAKEWINKTKRSKKNQRWISAERKNDRYDSLYLGSEFNFGQFIVMRSFRVCNLMRWFIIRKEVIKCAKSPFCIEHQK